MATLCPNTLHIGTVLGTVFRRAHRLQVASTMVRLLPILCRLSTDFHALFGSWPQWEAMHVHMLSLCYYHQIFNPVIRPITIKMMYLFMVAQIVSHRLFHNQSMLKNIAETVGVGVITCPNKDIAMPCVGASSLPEVAIGASILPDMRLPHAFPVRRILPTEQPIISISAGLAPLDTPIRYIPTAIHTVDHAYSIANATTGVKGITVCLIGQ